jgi:transcriptional regulator with XRE-family HTH domain
VDAAAVVTAARRRAGLTQSELASRAGTSQPVVSVYERGHRDPSVETLRRLVAAAGCQLVLGLRAPPSDLPPPADAAEHGRRLLDVLSLADAVPRRPRPDTMTMPRLVSR